MFMAQQPLGHIGLQDAATNSAVLWNLRPPASRKIFLETFASPFPFADSYFSVLHTCRPLRPLASFTPRPTIILGAAGLGPNATLARAADEFIKH